MTYALISTCRHNKNIFKDMYNHYYMQIDTKQSNCKDKIVINVCMNYYQDLRWKKVKINN